jgi:hypothetical protein
MLHEPLEEMAVGDAKAVDQTPRLMARITILRSSAQHPDSGFPDIEAE